MALRVILTTGGTGGHIFPALAVAEALKGSLPDVQILFVGGEYGPEGDLVRKGGLDFQGLKVRGMIGRGAKAVGAMVSMARGVVQASRLVSDFKPDVVVGFGGYAAFATVFAAWTHGRPTCIHEQNAVPGVTNRVLGKLVRQVYLSWPDSGSCFPAGKSLLTGNPIRSQIEKLAEAGGHRSASRPTLLVMGGSQGARAVNSLVITHLAAFRDAGIRVLHQTGSKDLERVREAYKSHGFSPEDVEDMVVPFMDDMAFAYSQADLALCRAGATTLAELAASGTPSILVPFPHAAHDHQTGNALAMQRAGGGILVPENKLDEQDMPAMILDLLRDAKRLGAMRQGALSMARPDAARDVAKEIINLATNHTGR